MMKLENMVMLRVKKVSYTVDPVLIAVVDVTSGYLWWKKTTRRKVKKEFDVWFFIDDGSIAPKEQLLSLERSWWGNEDLKQLELRTHKEKQNV